MADALIWPGSVHILYEKYTPLSFVPYGIQEDKMRKSAICVENFQRFIQFLQRFKGKFTSKIYEDILQSCGCFHEVNNGLHGLVTTIERMHKHRLLELTSFWLACTRKCLLIHLYWKDKRKEKWYVAYQDCG